MGLHAAPRRVAAGKNCEDCSPAWGDRRPIHHRLVRGDSCADRAVGLQSLERLSLRSAGRRCGPTVSSPAVRAPQPEADSGQTVSRAGRVEASVGHHRRVGRHRRRRQPSQHPFAERRARPRRWRPAALRHAGVRGLRPPARRGLGRPGAARAKRRWQHPGGQAPAVLRGFKCRTKSSRSAFEGGMPATLEIIPAVRPCMSAGGGYSWRGLPTTAPGGPRHTARPPGAAPRPGHVLWAGVPAGVAARPG